MQITLNKDNNIAFVVKGILTRIDNKNNIVTIKAQVKDNLKNINMVLSKNVNKDFYYNVKFNNQVKLWGNVLEKDNSYILEIIGGQLCD